MITNYNRSRNGPPALAMMIACMLPTVLFADPTAVTVFNYVRAESDHQMNDYTKRIGGLGKLLHLREPWSVEPDKQPTIRGNRDTLYSFAVFDLTTPVVITKPKSPNRFQTMMSVNQDGSTPPTESDGGTFTLTQKDIGTRYVWVVFRTFANPNDSEDLKAAHALQDQIKIQQKDPGSLELPEWDDKSLVKVRKLLNELGSLSITDFKGYFGVKDTLDPIKHLLGAAYGWGGNPDKAAMYAQVTPRENDGKTPYVLNVKDVPVDGFWSISVYNKDGFFQKNEYNAYTLNNVTGKPNKDGSFTIHFGGDPKAINFLPITEGWNYTVRMYEPHQEIIDGKWKFPEATLAK